MGDFGRSRGPLNDASGVAAGSSVQILAADNYRNFLLIQNVDATNDIWVNFGAAANKGAGSYKLAPEATMEFDHDFVVSSSVNIIADAGSPPFTLKWSAG